ncbi:CLIP-associated protein isoform X3 [Elaeis guineensis]|uniref:CLIP-associated protein isoform X3 n=1 Tax=Elaeis guineensis var. tenera TaxID=51953 RepID=UPI003C6D2F31
MHKSWRVWEEFARIVATAVLQLLNDPNNSIMEAATLCIEEMYIHVGPQFHEELQRYHLPSSMMKEMNSRLEKLESKVRPSNGVGTHFISTELKSFTSNQKRSSPKTKSIPRESLFSGEIDVTEKPVDPIKVFFEKESIKEIEKIASTLVPEKDWSLRIAAMQRVEGLVFGDAADYLSLPMLLKQLVAPLSTQLSDRRSSIVKQGEAFAMLQQMKFDPKRMMELKKRK